MRSLSVKLAALATVASAAVSLLASACGSDDAAGPNPPADGGGASSGDGGSSGGADSGTSGTVTGGACSDVGLPAAAALGGLRGKVRGSTAQLRFEPVAGAKDYRVFALPAKEAVTPAGAITNATYRCAGPREAPKSVLEDADMPQSYAVRTRVASTVEGQARTKPDATLGWVFTAEGAGRVPIYAMGSPAEDADNSCYFQRWKASRVKRYVTAEERTSLLASHWRDDGIAFYAPDPASAGAVGIDEVASGKSTLFVAEGSAEHTARKGDSPKKVFAALPAEQPDTVPLFRVFYDNGCGSSHDELVAGQARFDRAYEQGPTSPVDVLHWSGITGPVTLVVEALDNLCPFQGILSPTAHPAARHDDIDYPALLTLDQMRAASPTGEVFIGGMGPAAQPKAIARACVSLTPGAADALDVRVPEEAETFTEAKSTEFQTWRFESPTVDVQVASTTTDVWAVGSVLGELVTPHADWAADTNGKIRITPKTKGAIEAGAYLYARMEVDAHSTDRRYPQLIVSTADIPVQNNLASGTSVVVEPIGISPTELQIQLCDHRTWEVNNQCPHWDLYHLDLGGKPMLAPNPEVMDETGVDRTNFFEVYVSTKRVYVWFDEAPYGCVDLPATGMPAGPATVTFGDVLYHSGVDLADWQPLHKANYQIVTSRHFSNLGFASHRPLPAWDEARLPCVPANALK